MATERSWRSTLSSLLVMIGVWALSVSTTMETCPQCACSELTVEHTSALNIFTTEGGNASFSCRRNNGSFQDEWYVHTRDGPSFRVGNFLFNASLPHLLQYTSQSLGEEGLTYSLTLRNLTLLENGLLVTCASELFSTNGAFCSYYPRRPFTLTVLPLANEDCEEILGTCRDNLTACEEIKETLEMKIRNTTKEYEEEIEEYKEEIEEYKEEIEKYEVEIKTCEKAKNECLEREEELETNISLCTDEKISLKVARQESENDTRVCEENMTVVIAILLSSVIVNVALLIAVSVLCCKLRSRSKKFKDTTPTAITEMEASVKENVEAR